jgi:hypothetical protein
MTTNKKSGGSSAIFHRSNLIMNLFENINIEQKEEIKTTCSTCEHRQRWETESGRVFQYCGVRKSKRTDNKLLKIKCKQKSCGAYKQCDL